MKCYECGWPRISRTRHGARVCPRCGTKARADLPPVQASPNEQPSKTVQYFVGFFAVLGLSFPFFVPLIVKVSLTYPMELGTPW